jgi:hypothetical protein
MSQNYCHHINAAGAFCRGIPVKKRDYCFWHLNETGRRMKAARARAHSERVTLQLPVLDDLHAVQVGLMQLGEAIVHGEIDERRGRLLLAVLRLAASNIKAQGDWLDEAQMQDWNETSYVAENAGFEEQYGLRKGFDLSVDPEEAFPPPEPQVETSGAPHIPGVGMCGSDNLPLNPTTGLNGAPVLGNDDLRARLGQVLRAAATPIPGVDIHATADDMELMDVYERQGEQAGLQRATELERNRKRRERRERRTHFEEMARNRSIQLAAEKLFADQQRQAGAVGQGSAERHAVAGNNRKPPQSEGNGSSALAADAGLGTA